MSMTRDATPVKGPADWVAVTVQPVSRGVSITFELTKVVVDEDFRRTVTRSIGISTLTARD